MIPEYAKSAFEIKDTDSKTEILNKRYWLYRDKIGRQIEAEQRLKEFEKKYDEIKRLKNNRKSTIDELKLQLAVESLLNE